ncbi:hypothetical protein T492DRAFT_1145435 [Pavlovales sp. CCMP2436]|nr:hypothetical protein T492DRAFT_1145435 [Pavlovales sp. CCMP2436]
MADPSNEETTTNWLRKFNLWNFVGANIDQGFMFHMYSHLSTAEPLIIFICVQGATLVAIWNGSLLFAAQRICINMDHQMDHSLLKRNGSLLLAAERLSADADFPGLSLA